MSIGKNTGRKGNASLFATPDTIGGEWLASLGWRFPGIVADKIFPVALRLWLVFLFLFLLMGYAIAPSILFGAVGGFAGGFVSAWWQTPGGEPKREEATTTEANPLGNLGSKLRPAQLDARLPFLRLFTRRDRRYSGPRRP